MTNTTHANPFRNALITFELLPDELKDQFLDSFVVDTEDLAHNGNPLEHEPASNEEEAIAYVQTFDGVGQPNSRFATKQYLETLAAAFDLIPDTYQEDETTFAGGHIATGLYLDYPGGPYLDSAFCFHLNRDDDDETVLTFLHDYLPSSVRLIAETKVS